MDLGGRMSREEIESLRPVGLVFYALNAWDMYVWDVWDVWDIFVQFCIKGKRGGDSVSLLSPLEKPCSLPPR